MTPKVVALAASLGVLLASCLADYEPVELVVVNASDEVVVVLVELHDGREMELATLRPEETLSEPSPVTMGLFRRGCQSRGVWLLRAEDGELLARRELREEPLCDREAWVWTGEP